MGITKKVEEQIDELAKIYTEKLRKKALAGKELAVPRRGRAPSGVPEENLEEYIKLRDELTHLKNLRKESTTKLRDLKEQMEGLRTGPKPKRKSKK